MIKGYNYCIDSDNTLTIYKDGEDLPFYSVNDCGDVSEDYVQEIIDNVNEGWTLL